MILRATSLSSSSDVGEVAGVADLEREGERDSVDVEEDLELREMVIWNDES